MRRSTRCHAWAAPLLLLVCAVPAANAVVLDWSSVTWTAGSLSNSFDVDPLHAGTDLTVTVGGSTAELVGDSVNNLATPNINTNLAGGFAPAPDSLNLAIDLGKKDRSVSVTITFSPTYTEGVANLSFTIFDIDRATDGTSYIDEIRGITGIAADGTTVVIPTISALGSAVTLTGTGANQTLTGIANSADTGTGSGAGNATITFGSIGLTSVTFTFGANTANSISNPLYQQISLGDISFTPVPEVNPAFAGAGACLIAGFLVQRLRHKPRAVANLKNPKRRLCRG